MKTKLGVILGLTGLLCAGAAFADDDAVYSANAVGVVKYTIPGAGKLICVNLPMLPMDGTATEWRWSETTLAQQLPNSTIAYFWDNTSWASSTKGSRGWNGIGATKTLGLDEAFFIKSPASSGDITVSLLGEVPTESSQVCSVTGGGALVTRGTSMYPVVSKFATSALASNLPSGSVVYFWDGNSWASSTKGSRGWNGIGATVTNFVGEGIFVKSAQTQDIEIPRPFEW